eukprot:5107753-Ditylum_brightwellii.AAC.1
MAWGCTDEEQEHKTLHSHWSLWIEGFNSIKSLLYHVKGSVRNQALSEIQKSADKIMCTSYDNVAIRHTCNSRTMRKTFDKILLDPSQQLQCDMHHEDHCNPPKGIIGKCSNCQLEFTAQNIVNNALIRWNNIGTGRNQASILFLLHCHCLNMYAMRH